MHSDDLQREDVLTTVVSNLEDGRLPSVESSDVDRVLGVLLELDERLLGVVIGLELAADLERRHEGSLAEKESSADDEEMNGRRRTLA